MLAFIMIMGNGDLSTVQNVHPNRYVPQGGPVVAYGHRALSQLAGLADETGATRFLVVTGRSLAREGSLIRRITELLGSRLVGVFDGCREHTPDVTVAAGTVALTESGADGLISVGGSSVVDTAKAMALASVLGDDLSSYHAFVEFNPDGSKSMRRGRMHDDLRGLRRSGSYVVGGRNERSRVDGKVPPILAVPTTLSGAEFTEHAGVTNEATGVKRQIYHPNALPMAVVMDPYATATTPLELWVSTGIKVLDHAVEIIASPLSSPVSEAACLGALRRVFTNIGPSSDPTNLQARAEMQTAAWLALAGYPNQMAGLNHGIGHQLGGLFGVPHGIAASCTLSHTMRFNRDAATDSFSQMIHALDRSGPVSHGGTEPPIIAAVEELVGSLDLPNRLRDVGVPRDALPKLAELVVEVEAGILGNPRAIASADEILAEVLEPAW